MVGYVLLLDLLGFSNIVCNLQPADLDSRIDEWVTLAKQAAKDSSIDKLSMLSDTVFAATDSSEEGFLSLIEMARTILNAGIELSLPVKGAITHGEYTWGHLIYGKAVIEAHELESQQTWVGISCTNALPHIDKAWGYEKLLCYPTPKKSGRICLHPVVSWDAPEFDILQSALLKKGLSKPGETLSWRWADRIQHTMAFALYKRILISAKAPAHTFRGFLPIQTIEMNIEKA